MHFLRLTRETTDQCCTKRNIRHTLTKMRNPLDQFCFVRLTTHSAENLIITMLYRHIQIMAYLFVTNHRIDQFFIDFLRVAVHNTDPKQSGDFVQSIQKLMQTLLPIQIHTVKCCFLRNKDQFLDTAFYQFFRRCYQFLHRNASITSTHRRNHTIRAILIAAFRNL